MINYADQHHVYFNQENIIYDSPTKILKRYRERFDAKTRAKAYAKKYGKTPKYWLEQWKNKSTSALLRGHTIHSDREEGSFGRGIEKISGVIRPVHNGILYQPQNLENLPDGVYNEFPVWNDGWKIAGRPDKFVVETIEEKRFADIYDFKTNFKIDKVSYKDIKTGNYKYMLKPVEYLMDSKWIEYALQLSMYGYILETHGFIIRSLQLIHIPHPIDLMGLNVQPKDVIYPVPYLKPEVLKIFDHYNRQRSVAYYKPVTK